MKCSIIMRNEMESKSKAGVDIWQYVFALPPMGAVKCAIDLQIADILEGHGGAMSLSELSSATGCSPSALRRIMRYLIHRGFFKQEESTSSISYAQTPLSRLLLQQGDDSMAAYFLLQNSPVMLDRWVKLSSRTLTNQTPDSSDEFWEYASKNPAFSKVFNEAMACHARQAVSQILGGRPQVFEGIGCLVDVGGGDGTAISSIVKGCPCIRGINFDLPHVASAAPPLHGVQHVGGDMFKEVPKADAVFIMWVLHDWGDEECIEILKKCKEAVPKETGKVIIAEAVIGEGEGEGDKYINGIRLALDMVMFAHTDTGKQRTIEEWKYVLNGAGFSSYTVKDIGSIISIIEAYP